MRSPNDDRYLHERSLKSSLNPTRWFANGLPAAISRGQSAPKTIGSSQVGSDGMLGDVVDDNIQRHNDVFVAI